ncbi:E3 ubiquitin-protein ligase COP1-like isoform X1 [Contarinia nasturtii]|uniref:E3 ubiquitin-protein ligase COP1-like isoform X1 n=1 Tax=Contarinia nasturtii TaxID=265458 RepID=UPI0012D3BD43|nr:E3 ubiquitin-protein ligase COP1-like isoform X1 [Contarinia nasturtii]XP_031638786.1 E3 ubiquitin-protein ligase COP1-like isoform X1 [Contarinia nasturtii]
MSRHQSSPHVSGTAANSTSSNSNNNNTLSGLNASSSSSAALFQQNQVTQPNAQHVPLAGASNSIDDDMQSAHHSRMHHADNKNTNKRSIALNGIGSTVENKNVDFLCPICFDLIIEAHITRCGHTFCFRCITKSVEIFKRCPKCSYTLSTCENIFPNYLLDELITKYKIKKQIHDKVIGGRTSRGGITDDITLGPAGDGLKHFLTSESQKLTLPDVNIIMDILQQRKQLLEAESNTAQNRLLYDFLKQLLQLKEKKKTQIENEIELIQKDLAEVEFLLKNTTVDTVTAAGVSTVPTTSTAATANETTTTTAAVSAVAATMGNLPDTPMTTNASDENENGEALQRSNSISKDSGARTESFETVLSGDDGFNTLKPAPTSQTYLSRKRRMYAHFDDFVTSYFSIRNQDLVFGTKDEVKLDESGKKCEFDHTSKRKNPGLDLFRENLVQFSKYNTLRPLATMHYSSDLHNNSTIVSTIVFDKDNEFFAIGGVTRRIKIFDYLAVVRDTVDIHYPNVEMISNSKISCITWNSYYKQVMASSDYEGAVTLWDVQTGTQTRTFNEHEKRCWSVDFNNIEARLIASGSDDARVKLWSTQDERSIATLEAKANVCCVKFNPKSRYHLAFGSADHDVHYYDLRNMSKALCIFKGHKKAVSYVKFLNTNEIISASTDSQLKLWNVNQPPYCLRSFVGHVNEKNFVGLATDSDYIACGSEDNALYIYYKGLSKPLFNFRIDSCSTGNVNSNGMIGVGGAASGNIGSSGISGTALETDRFNDVNEFVSAVCWRQQCNVVLAANSRGLIKVLELV